MLACDRELYVPEPYKEDAYRDEPVRVQSLDFNISAPHMHAMALEHLELQPGDRYCYSQAGQEKSEMEMCFWLCHATMQ
jgi:protein-L-isoaspartate O-methyltransferase